MDLQFVDLDSARSGCCVVMAGGLCRTCGGHRSDTFEVVGAEVAQSAVAASGVVPAFQEFEDCHPCFGLGLKRTPVDEFVLEGGEKAFRHRVVKAVAWNPAGGFQGILESRSVRSVRSVRSGRSGPRSRMSFVSTNGPQVVRNRRGIGLAARPFPTMAPPV